MKYSQFVRLMDHRNLTHKEKLDLATLAEQEYRAEQIAELEKIIRKQQAINADLQKQIDELRKRIESEE